MPDASESDRPTITKASDDRSSSIFDSEIGDDWGEAFEADDFALPPEEDSSSEFFLEEDEFEDTTESQKTIGPSATGEDPDTSVEKSEPGLPHFIANLLNQVKSVANAGKERFLSLPLIYKVPLLSVIFIALFSTYFFTKSPPPGPPVRHIPLQTTEEPPQTPEKIAALDILVSAEAPKEKNQTKWHFPSFLISTSDEMKGDNIFFVEVDITFILLLDHDENLPTNKSVFVRNIIYQFFNNRPLYELRRYSLARGEMNRKLRSWVEKQWPEGEIAAIVFNRYQVL